MSVGIVIDDFHGRAALYCDTTDFAFGPIFKGHDCDDQAEAFIEYVQEQEDADPREVDSDRLGELRDAFLLEWMVRA